jgi:hypothetical protein
VRRRGVKRRVMVMVMVMVMVRAKLRGRQTMGTVRMTAWY